MSVAIVLAFSRDLLEQSNDRLLALSEFACC